MNHKLSSEANIFLILLLFTAFLICISHKLILIKNLLLYFSKISKKRYPNGVRQGRYVNVGENACEECSVCLCEISQGGEIMQLPCDHIFHAVCLDKWLVSYGHCTCPFCRASLFPSAAPSPSSGASTVLYSGSDVEVLSFNFFGSSPRRRNSWDLM
ncbi:hypothetical protein DCAR_0832915 [Daucus carota subsp. sativus]|uniref:RING-type domain-containing protein n=1 Tax=Daucus carota subsp. sativus TaxID=79200 RepID=A0AAF0XSY7_DAUCS|nr:hypothetical protein DCAR_0832915 [Daucus carota subsp. sativus]